MHKVKRNKEPQGLKEKNEEFKKAIKDGVDVADSWNKFVNTKLGKETKISLYNMYKGCCAYCEKKLKLNRSAHIEHFKNKSKFPELCYYYNNLHYCCASCNINKGDTYSEDLIDPSKDEPRDHICYKGWGAIGLDERGTNMINVVNLNADERLVNLRGKCLKYKERFEVLLKILEKSNGLSEDVRNDILNSLDEIEKDMQHGMPYCTMVRDNFEQDINEIRKIIEK